MDDGDAAAAAIEHAAQDLIRTRRHAVWLERIAAMVLAFAACSGLAFAFSSGGTLIGVGLGIVLSGALAWGLVRALALVLHLRVDDRMIALADPEVDTARA